VNQSANLMPKSWQQPFGFLKLLAPALTEYRGIAIFLQPIAGLGKR
jgi:hypothetical protein